MLKMKMSRSRLLLQRSRQLLSRARSVSAMILVSSLGKENSYVNEQLNITVVSPGLFTSFKDMVQKEMQESFDKVDTEVANIKETMSQFMAPSDALGKTTAAEIPTPPGPIGKDQDNSSQSLGPSSTLMQNQAKSSQTPRPSAAKGRANVSVDPIAVRRSPRTVRKVTTT
ncbi:unnamed protein product [Eruca vesicaria subsp. sativa]|uniref:Uncharacterized protein n=1 Tax=Eruca vesicaria subsp. sativa TaxID=29727 RepID=A0ABC8IPM1_ERUVS|nr:unnamed protein product [Eruca vesicaria subsp. sativa]